MSPTSRGFPNFSNRPSACRGRVGSSSIGPNSTPASGGHDRARIWRIHERGCRLSQWRTPLLAACSNLLARGRALPAWIQSAPIESSAAGDDIDLLMLIEELKARAGRQVSPEFQERVLKAALTVEQQRTVIERALDDSWRSIDCSFVVDKGVLRHPEWLKTAPALLATGVILQKVNVEQFFQITKAADVPEEEVYRQLDAKCATRRR